MNTRTDTPEAPATQLTVIERASLALGSTDHEKRLVVMASESKAITAITNADGLKECHAARMRLKNERVSISKLGKEARDDATKFSKAVIEEETRLIALIEPEEKRLQAIQDAHEAKIEAEKQAKALAEAERVAKIQTEINAIKNFGVSAIGKSSAEIATLMDVCNCCEIGEWAAEFADVAQATKAATMDTLQKLHAAAKDQEDAKAKFEAERAELERQKEALAAQQRAENERIEAARIMQEGIERAARERIEAEEKASRDRIEAQERESRLRVEEQERTARIAREAEEARVQAERDAEDARIKAEHAEAAAALQAAIDREREKREAAEAVERAKRDAEAAAERERQRKETEIMDGREMLRTFKTRFGDVNEFVLVMIAVDQYLENVSEFYSQLSQGEQHGTKP